MARRRFKLLKQTDGTGGGGGTDTTDATVLTLDDQTAVFPNSRQLLAGTNITFDDSVPGERTIEAASGGGGSSGNVNADTHPTSPNAADDEFEDTVLDTSLWTWRNQGGATATLSQGSLILRVPVDASAAIRGIEQPISGTGVWRAKLTGDVTANFNVSGLGFMNTGNGRLITFGPHFSGVLLRLAATWNSTTSFGSSLAQSASIEPYGGIYQQVYYELAYDGTNIIGRISGSGIEGTFKEFFSTAASGFLGTPDRVLLLAAALSGSTTPAVVCDWFRKVA